MSDKIRIKLYLSEDFIDENGKQYVNDKAVELLRENDEVEPETIIVSNVFVSEHIGKHILFECKKKSDKTREEILESISEDAEHFEV